MTEEEAVLGSDQIDWLISEGQTHTAQRAQNIVSRDGILCLTLEASELLAAVEKIVQYPSKYRMDEYKQASKDPALVAAINDPYVKVALQLKQSFDLGKLSLFTHLTQFQETHALTVPDDPIVAKFVQQVKYYLPPLPYIRDEDLRCLSLNTEEPSQELYIVGRTRFLSIVGDLLFIRFPEQDIMKDVMTYVSAKHTAAVWAQWYELIDADEDQETAIVPAHERFYNFFGALILSNTLPADEFQLKSIVSILIEPILQQFDEGDTPNESAKDELEQQIDGVNYEHIHTTSHESPQDMLVLVHAYGGYDTVLVGMGYGHTLAEAESRAAAMALYKKSHLDRAIENIKAIANERPVVEEIPEASISKQQDYDYGYMPLGPAPSLLTYPTSSTPSPAMGGMAGTVGALVPMHPGTLVTQDYYDAGNVKSVPLAPNLDDELVDKSSKQRLNDLLLELRFAPAEWKTSKMSNSDVQVMCTIENIQIARCISTNKKKAGHLCAQFILSDPENMFRNLPPR